MFKKLFFSTLAVIIFLSSFSTVTFASSPVGKNDSASTIVYVEPNQENLQQYSEIYEYMIQHKHGNIHDEATHMNAIDEFLLQQMTTYRSQYDFYAIFVRRLDFDNQGNKVGGMDSMKFVRVQKGAIFKRNGGRIKFTVNGTDSPYNNLYHVSSVDSVVYKWGSAIGTGTTGISVYETDNVKFITVPIKIDWNSRYDPNDPPPYAVPDYSSPYDGVPVVTPGTPTDPNFPVQPQPPDNSWDLIGWIKYIVDWIVYLVKCLVYFIKALATAIGDVFTGSASLISALGQVFSFLPNQITAILTLGVLALIVVGIVRK